jgi:hypothetical protein
MRSVSVLLASEVFSIKCVDNPHVSKSGSERENWYRASWIALILLFGLALFVRLLNLDTDVNSDEAYYYYLTVFPEKYLILHRNHPFLLYVLYHPFAGSLVSFRLVNVLVGSVIPILVYVLLGSYGLSSKMRILGGAAAAINPTLVKFSWIVYLDTLATTLLLLGLLSYKKERWLTTGIALGLSVLTKEYALLAALIIILGSWFRYHSPKTTLLSGFGVGATTLVFLYILFPLGGMTNLTNNVAFGQSINSYVTFALLIMIIVGTVAVLIGLREEGLIVIAYAAFIIGGGFNAGWYLVLPLPFLIISILVSLDRLLGKLKLPTTSGTSIFRFRWFTEGVRIMLVLVFLFSVSNPIAAYNQSQSWHYHGLRDVTTFLTNQYQNRRITLIDCFWAYSLYPFGTHYSVKHEDYTGDSHSLEYYEGHVLETGLAVFCNTNVNMSIRNSLLYTFRNSIVYSQEGYTVLALRPSDPLTTSDPCKWPNACEGFCPQTEGVQ